MGKISMVSYSYFLKQFLAAVNGEIHSPVEISACSAPSPTNHIKRPSDSASQEIWRPASGRACEYVADLERIRHDALRRPEWKGRPKLFEFYDLHTMEYKSAIRLVGVADGTFDYWAQEVKRATGREFSRCGLFPPSRYFHS